MSVTVLGTAFRNPVLLAAGTAGFGREIAGVLDLASVGGLVTKAVSVEPRAGNPAPRVAEFGDGMLNSVGLANPGLDVVRAEVLPWLRVHAGGTRVLLNVVGRTVEDFVAVVAALADETVVTAFELNVSCPNVAQGGLEFGADITVLGDLVRRARDATARPLVVKLSPALVDPARTAVAAAEAGADAFTCVNTMPALAYADRPPFGPRLGNGTGGLSGPPLLPIGLRVTKLVAEATGKPVIGAGGVRTGRDAWQYLRAGATLVAVGTASFADPRAPARIARELEGIQREEVARAPS